MAADLIERLQIEARDARNLATARYCCEDAIAEIERLRALLREARDGLYNGFEPDNQSALWHRLDKAVK